jgi:hypothetical protein
VGHCLLGSDHLGGVAAPSPPARTAQALIDSHSTGPANQAALTRSSLSDSRSRPKCRRAQGAQIPWDVPVRPVAGVGDSRSWSHHAQRTRKTGRLLVLASFWRVLALEFIGFVWPAGCSQALP